MKLEDRHTRQDLSTVFKMFKRDIYLDPKRFFTRPEYCKYQRKYKKNTAKLQQIRSKKILIFSECGNRGIHLDSQKKQCRPKINKLLKNI